MNSYSSLKRCSFFSKRRLIPVVLLAGFVGGCKTQPPPVTNSTQATDGFNVPALLNKDFDDVITLIGQPNGLNAPPDPRLLERGLKKWGAEWKKGGKRLLVTYNLADRRVIDCFISGEAEAEGTFPKSELLKFGNLREDDPRYKVHFVPAKKGAGRYAALRAVSRATDSKATKPPANKAPQQKK